MIKVLIIDDSALIRKVLSEELSRHDDIQVAGTAVDPYAGREKIAQLSPDVITLDLEMPRMDGLTFLAALMKHHPIPVVVISSLTADRSEAALRALELGAVEVIGKPGSGYRSPDMQRVVRAVRAAASAKLKLLGFADTPVSQTKPAGFRLQTTHKIVAIGASTGGTKAIEAVLSAMPPMSPGTVIVQHMPEHFTDAFARRLDKICHVRVREAKDGDPVVPGVALIAPGNKHMVLVQSGASYTVRIKDGPAVHFQRPSVDVLFQSVAQHAGSNAVGVLLTGMGADGARGLKEMRLRGARTMVQDEATSVVFGMPKEALRLDAADEIHPLQSIAPAILRLFGEQPERKLTPVGA